MKNKKIRKKSKPYINKGRPRPPFSKEWRDNMRKAKLGYKVSEEVKKKISLAHKGKPKPQTAIAMRKRIGILNNNWKGGLSSLHQQIRNTFNYRLWRSDIYKRDNYTCQHCFMRGGYIEADHIKPLALIVQECKIDCVEKAINCDELWNINNGRTLCKSCHYKTHTYGRPQKKQS